MKADPRPETEECEDVPAPYESGVLKRETATSFQFHGSQRYMQFDEPAFQSEPVHHDPDPEKMVDHLLKVVRINKERYEKELAGLHFQNKAIKALNVQLIEQMALWVKAVGDLQRVMRREASSAGHDNSCL